MFTYNETHKIKKYFKEYGYVVITNVINDQEIENTINEICSHPALLGEYNFNLKDPSSWDKPHIAEYGFVDVNQGHSQGHSQNELEHAWYNRQHPKVVSSFQNILDTQEIVVNEDRFAVMRPTKVNSEWKTLDSWLHWDKNPWAYPEFSTVQGLLTLTEHTKESGGFCCIPKFHLKLKEWTENNLDYKHKDHNETNPIVDFPQEEHNTQDVKKILAPAGSLIIWDSGLPHCNYPNDGYDFRIAQYITFQRKDSLNDQLRGVLKQSYLEAHVANEKFLNNILTPVGKKILNFDEFEKKYPITPKDIEAYQEYKKGCQLEIEENFTEAIKHYTKAEKLSDLVGQIYL